MTEIVPEITTLNQILENSTQDDIAVTDEILGDLIKENYNISLMYHICESIPIKTPEANVYVQKRNQETNNFEIIKKNIQTKTTTLVTGFTQEVFQDMQKSFKYSAKNASGKILSGVSSREENSTLLKMLNSESDVKETLQITDSNNLESIILQLSRKVSECVLEMNQDTYKTLDSFCILDRRYAAAILGTFNFMTEKKERSLFVGRVGRTDYYLNPFPNTSSEFNDAFDISYEIEETSIPNYCYVGLVSNIPGQSSLIHAPYSYERQYITDPDTGDIVLILRNRYGLTTSPLHEPLKNKSMLHKFQIQGL